VARLAIMVKDVMLLPPPSHSSPVAMPAARTTTSRSARLASWSSATGTPTPGRQISRRYRPIGSSRLPVSQRNSLVETDLEAPILRVRNFVARILSATS
jgi:hypothetical protein